MSGKYGKVYLIGSGPGDPELLTLKARRLIDSAEVIVYDQLPGKAILESMPASAEKIDVGKYAGNHTMTQPEINELLVQKAKDRENDGQAERRRSLCFWKRRAKKPKCLLQQA